MIITCIVSQRLMGRVIAYGPFKDTADAEEWARIGLKGNNIQHVYVIPPMPLLERHTCLHCREFLP